MTNPATLDGLAQPQVPVMTRPRVSAITFLWMVIWLSDVLSVFVHVSPVSPYYIVVVPFIGYLLVVRPVDCLRVASRPMFWLWLLTALFPLILYVSSPGLPYEAYASLRVRTVFFSVVIATAALLTTPEPLRIIRPTALAVLILSVSINALEIVAGQIFTTTPGRAAGFYLNPNRSAAAISIMMLLCMNPAKQTRGSLALMTFGFAGVMLTFSRSGMLFGGALWLYHAFFAAGSGRGGNVATRTLLIITLVIAFAIGAVSVLRFGDIADDAQARVTNTLQGKTDDNSALDRIAAIRDGWSSFMERPFTGHGLGAPEILDLQLHNTFLHLSNEFGILGLLLFLTILLVPLARGLFLGRQQGLNTVALAGLVLYYSMFDHYVHASTVFAVAFGILAVDALRLPPPTAASPAAPPTNPPGFQ
jgi:O-antigen ligase